MTTNRMLWMSPRRRQDPRDGSAPPSRQRSRRRCPRCRGDGSFGWAALCPRPDGGELPRRLRLAQLRREHGLGRLVRPLARGRRDRWCVDRSGTGRRKRSVLRGHRELPHPLPGRFVVRRDRCLSKRRSRIRVVGDAVVPLPSKDLRPG